MPLGEDTWCSRSLIARVRRTRWLDQQDMHFTSRHRPVLNADRHNKDLAWVEGDGAIPQLDVERALKHKKEIVRVVVFVPVEWSLKFGHHDVVVVVNRNGARREPVGERCQLLGEVCRCFHCISKKRARPSVAFVLDPTPR